MPMPVVSMRWTNTPASRALALLLDAQGLRAVEDSKTHSARLVRKEKWDQGGPEDSAVRARLEKLVRDAVGPVANAAEGFTLIARPLDQVRPVRIILEADQPPSLGQIEGILPAVSSQPIHGVSTDFTAEPVATNSNVFRVLLGPSPAPAADYLAWSDEVEGDYELIREALKRPYARMGGDYENAFSIRIPNFVALRMAAQRQSTRARCHLLLGQPEAALRELTLVHDLNRMLEARPANKPMTLVAAMIEVAISGLYTSVVADGLRLTAWREPELRAIQRQLAEVDLPPLVRLALSAERAGFCHTVENTATVDLAKFFSMGDPNKAQTGSIVWKLVPRGWIYQNMAVVARLDGLMIEPFDPKNRQIFPSRLVAADRELQATFNHRSPYTVLAAIAIPNFMRALITAAHNQTSVNEALIACGLERYRMVHGEYPAALGALVPEFVAQVPRDLIGGGPLIYRRVDNTHFLLYSIGWNETDDGGITTTKPERGDWTWDTQ
jgi:hypothetical protein